jgi:acyl-CoA thioesterase I
MPTKRPRPAIDTLIPCLALALAAASARAQTAAPIKWAAVGNSITEGSGYPAKLQTLLGPAYKVENEGVSATTMLKKGNYTYWANGKLPQTFAFKPDIVSIKLGTNDSKPVNWPGHKNEFLGDTKALIDTLAGMPSKPRIFPCYPVPVFQKGGAWVVDGINEPVVKNEIMPMIKQAAADKNLTLIDLHTFLESRADLFANDGVHPDAGKPGADSIALMIFRSYTAAVTRVACHARGLHRRFHHRFRSRRVEPSGQVQPVAGPRLLRAQRRLPRRRPAPEWAEALFQKRPARFGVPLPTQCRHHQPGRV